MKVGRRFILFCSAASQALLTLVQTRSIWTGFWSILHYFWLARNFLQWQSRYYSILGCEYGTVLFFRTRNKTGLKKRIFYSVIKTKKSSSYKKNKKLFTYCINPSVFTRSLDCVGLGSATLVVIYLSISFGTGIHIFRWRTFPTSKKLWSWPQSARPAATRPTRSSRAAVLRTRARRSHSGSSNQGCGSGSAFIRIQEGKIKE